MYSVQGNELKSDKRAAFLAGEFILVRPEEHYLCKIAHLFEGENREDDLCIYPDSDYSFYELGLWDGKTRSLYPKGTILLVFEHEVRDNINVNQVVESGQAKCLTQSEFDTMRKELLEKGYFISPTAISRKEENPLVWERIMQQMNLERRSILVNLLPDAALAEQILTNM